MSRVLEDVGKEILRKNGVPIPEFRVAASPGEARKAAEELGAPVMIKALVPVGKRGKAGAVKGADDPAQAEGAAREILFRRVGGFPVERLLVERRVEIARELYLSITFDPSRQLPVIIAGTEGGVDVEETARRQPQQLARRHVNILEGLHPYATKEVWSGLGLKGRSLLAAADVLWKLYQVFQRYDLTLLEINPLALTAREEAVAAAVLMAVDDDALGRQPELSARVEAGSDRAWRPLTPLEREMIAVDQADPYRGTARYTEMEGGDIGFFCGGGGGSLLVYDTLVQLGGRPANYTEFGGNPTEAKVYGLVKGILSKPGVKGFILDINITNNTQTDLVAKGFVRAVKELAIDRRRFPIVIRLAGVNEPEARRVLEAAGIEYHGDDITMEDAARLIIERMKSADPQGG